MIMKYCVLSLHRAAGRRAILMTIAATPTNDSIRSHFRSILIARQGPPVQLSSSRSISTLPTNGKGPRQSAGEVGGLWIVVGSTAGLDRGDQRESAATRKHSSIEFGAEHRRCSKPVLIEGPGIQADT